MRLFLRAKQCPVLGTTTKYWKVLLCTSTTPVLTALYGLHVGWYWVWDLGNSKNQGISGYMAPIVAQELVRTRGVSYLNKLNPYRFKTHQTYTWELTNVLSCQKIPKNRSKPQKMTENKWESWDLSPRNTWSEISLYLLSRGPLWWRSTWRIIPVSK